MNGKIISITLVAVLLLPLLSITVFAADDDIGNTGLLYGILDGMGGFFRDIGNKLASGFNNTIDSIKGIGNSIVSALSKAVDAIGGFFSKVISAISNAVNSLLKGIRDLFVPHDDYFSSILEELQAAINGKLGGLLYLITYLKTRFSQLSAPANLDRMFVLEFPAGHIFGGTRLDFLYRIRNLLPLFRGLLTFCFIVIPTVAYCYNRVRDMIKT